MKVPFEPIDVVTVAESAGMTIEEAIKTGRELEEEGLGVMSMDGLTFMFTPNGIDCAQALSIREKMREMERERKATFLQPEPAVAPTQSEPVVRQTLLQRIFGWIGGAR